MSLNSCVAAARRWYSTSFVIFCFSSFTNNLFAASAEEVVVTASRVDLIGVAETASQGSVTQQEVELRPIYRVGQLLESTPGLVVTTHSGEGKANQYLLGGFNLDHGTDFASFVDDMPVNRPTNAHGQGYSDLNFIMPQLIKGIDFTKGPYYASVGDFGAVGSAHLQLVDDLPAQLSASAGTLGDQELFGGGTYHFNSSEQLLGALSLSHVDGPFSPPENFRKVNAITRYSNETDKGKLSVTAMYYNGEGRNSTDQPQRAIDQGLIGRYGTLDPSDGNRAQRLSLSVRDQIIDDRWELATNAYVIHSKMTLWNNFTHLLNDPVNGDQEQQNEERTTAGGGIAYTRRTMFGSIASDTVFGLQERYDVVDIDRRHTKDRHDLNYCNNGNGDYSVGEYACSADRAQLNDIAPYVQNTTHWLSWLRTVIGARENYYSAKDRSRITDFEGSTSEWLFQPKGSIVFGPWCETEFYVSAGKGFHSDDARGVLNAVPLQGAQLAIGYTPLMAETFGEEIGIRNASIANLQMQLAVFRETFKSELTYDQDSGQDESTAPSRRQGVEFSAQYHPTPWLEFNTDLAKSSAHYTKNATTLADVYEITGGNNIANAPSFIGSFGMLIDNLGPWFGGLQERILGSYPLTDGPSSPRGAGYKETNVDIGYKFTTSFKAQLSIYNLFDTKAYAAEYYYATAITPEESSAGGVNDYQLHPMEPRSARLTLTKFF